jgi:hypothetical protein
MDQNRNKLPNPKHPKTQLSQLPTPGPTVNPNYPNPHYSEMLSIFLQHGNPSLLKNSTPEHVVSIRIDIDRSDPLSPPKPVQQHSVNYNHPSKFCGVGQEMILSANYDYNYNNQSEVPDIPEARRFADPPLILFDKPPVTLDLRKTSEFGTGVESLIMVRNRTFEMPPSYDMLFRISDLGKDSGVMNFGESHLADPHLKGLDLEGTPV